jgi:hypothetical protein
MSVGPAIAAAHRCVAAVVRSGDLAVDATAGNGHDTLFLAGLVGPGGRVAAVDAQAEAVTATRQRLAAAALSGRVLLHQGRHEELGDSVPGDWAGAVRGVLFNLGYLPGSDKALVTRPATTRAALAAALALLAPGGRLAVVAYPGHPGGADEAAAVATWAGEMASAGYRRLADGRPRYGVSPGAPRLTVLERPYPSRRRV